MTNPTSVRHLADQFGEVLRSILSGQWLYYAVKWEDLREEACLAAREKGRPEPDDVRVAQYALELLGIPSQWVEADIDDSGEWIVYWR